MSKGSQLVWFTVSTLFSAFGAAIASTSTGGVRAGAIFLAVHGGLWSILRGVNLALTEHLGTGKEKKG